MSKMSPVLTQAQRRQFIKENILLLTYNEISKKCGVTKRTIRRDVEAWKKEGGFTELLYDEFLKSYPDRKTNSPDKTFDRLCFLLGKTFTQKKEYKKELSFKTKHVEELNVTLGTYEDTIKKVLNRYVQPNSSS